MLNHKTTVFAAALALGAAVVATDASAFSLAGGYTGPVKFVFSNFDAATTGYPTTTLPPGTVPGPVCDTVAGCDGASPLASHAPGGIGSEDTWGIFTIARIENPQNGAVLWNSGQDSEYLHGMFYGLADQQVDYLGSIGGTSYWSAYSTGGQIDMYLTPTDTYLSAGPGGRTGLATYSGVTDGVLALSAVFSPTANLNVLSSTYNNQFNSATIAGNGVGYLDLTGGFLASNFNTNSVSDVVGNLHDFELDTTFSCNPSDTACHGTNAWSVTSTGQVKGAYVPEPGVLLLMGAGLFGLSGIRYRKAQRPIAAFSA